jgi:small acid-soluble spore protein (thioredoxin-like protein)
MSKRHNRPNPDNREDNVERLQKNIDYTISNIEAAEEMIAETSDERMKKTLSEKNDRRRDALNGFRSEIRDEANARNKKDE